MGAGPEVTGASPARPDYVLGHSTKELARLALQGRIYADATLDLLERAGVGPGMRVLDVGCGPGDVTALVAGRVGPSGSVLGVDLSEAAIRTARRRAEDAGLVGVSFRMADVAALEDLPPFDAVVGRFVLMHQTDPAGFLSQCARRARAGGIVAFLESQMHACVRGVHSHPHSPVFDRVLALQNAIIDAVGAHGDMGLRMRATFRAAGLVGVDQRMSAVVQGGADADIVPFAIESLRSMLPTLERHGVARLTEEELIRMEGELRSGLEQSDGVLVAPPVVGAWGQVPSDASGVAAGGSRTASATTDPASS